MSSPAEEKAQRSIWRIYTGFGSRNSASSFSIFVSKLFLIYISANIFFQKKLQLGGVCEKMI